MENVPMLRVEGAESFPNNKQAVIIKGSCPSGAQESGGAA